MPRTTRRIRLLIPAALGLVLFATTGCYERVVRQRKGIGNRPTEIHQSNLERSRIDGFDDFLDVAFDEDTKPKK